jgi:hypothetical protein
MLVSGWIGEMVRCADTLAHRAVPAVGLPHSVRPAGAHPEAERVEELSFDHLEVSEMQDETQEAAATSSPDPLTLEDPEDRDIDVCQSLPNSVADSSEA